MSKYASLTVEFKSDRKCLAGMVACIRVSKAQGEVATQGVLPITNWNPLRKRMKTDAPPIKQPFTPLIKKPV